MNSGATPQRSRRHSAANERQASGKTIVKEFARLYEALDTTTSTRLKVDAMVGYLRAAAPADAAWATFILSGRKLKRLIGPALLRAWLVESSRLPAWLVEETYAAVGDLAETIALLVATGPAPARSRTPRATPWTARTRRERRSGSRNGSSCDFCRCAQATSRRAAPACSNGGRSFPIASASCSTSC
jgi:hypothetical protein